MIQPTADVAITSMEHAHSEVACLDDRIMLVRRLRDISRVPAQVEMLRAFLCIHGTATVHFERRTVLLGPNDLLVCPPDLECVLGRGRSQRGMLCTDGFVWSGDAYDSRCAELSSLGSCAGMSGQLSGRRKYVRTLLQPAEA